jgi:hypothetical protein
MIKFENKFFRRFTFSRAQLLGLARSAYKDLKIASGANVSEVKFQFAYNALAKLGIALIACYGYRVKSRVGHHVKILEKMAEILENEDVLAVGNQMRKDRNAELYDGGSRAITSKQAEAYFKFTDEVFGLAKKTIKKHLGTLF